MKKTKYNHAIDQTATILIIQKKVRSFILLAKYKKAFEIAAKKLRKLLYSTKGATDRLKNRNINEYYWFSEQHKKQYQFGTKMLALGNMNGLYSQGVGSANYAYKLFLDGKKSSGLRWAQKSQLIWEDFFQKCTKDYHDPWYWYALALGLQGKDKEMNLALSRSAKLAKINVNTAPAFKKLRKMLMVMDK